MFLDFSGLSFTNPGEHFLGEITIAQNLQPSLALLLQQCLANVGISLFFQDGHRLRRDRFIEDFCGRCILWRAEVKAGGFPCIERFQGVREVFYKVELTCFAVAVGKLEVSDAIE